MKRLLLSLALLLPGLGAAGPSPIVEWSTTQAPGRYSLLVRVISLYPEAEAYIVTIRYRLAGETVIREQRRAILRMTDQGLCTQVDVPTSAPATVTEIRVRELAILPESAEVLLQW